MHDAGTISMSTSSPGLDQHDGTASPGEQRGTACCACVRGRQTQRVGPAPGKHSRYNIVEVRPSRSLRIQHINPYHQDPESMTKHDRAGQTQCSPSGGRRPSQQKESSTESSPSSRGCTHREPGETSLPPGGFKKPDALADCDPGDRNTSTTCSDVKQEPGYRISANSRECWSSMTTQNVQIDLSQAQQSTLKTNSNNGPTPANINKETEIHPLELRDYSASDGERRRAPSQSKVGCGTVVFLIHGVGGSGDVWRSQVEFLRLLGYELVVPDLIGHGFSSAPRDSKAYQFCETEKDLLAVFDQFCGLRNVIIGHSYGGSFAAALARKRAHRVHRMVLVSGGSPTPLLPQPGFFNLPVCLLVCCRPLLHRGFRKSAFHQPKVEPGTLHCAFDVPTYVLKHTMRGQVWEEGDPEYHSFISAPTLIIHGEDDALISLQEEKEMEEVIQGSEVVVVKEASHMVMMEQPNQVNQLIYDFLLDDSQRVAPSTTAATMRRHKPLVHDSVRQSVTSLRSAKSIPSNLVANNLK